MANPRHVAMLNKGVARWNAWRKRRRDRPQPNLNGAALSRFEDPLYSLTLPGINLSGCTLNGVILDSADLVNANLARCFLHHAWLRGTDFRGANLSHSCLRKAWMYGADLSEARLVEAEIYGADLSWAKLDSADLEGADLRYVNLTGSSLDNANLRNVALCWTIFSDVDLSSVRGLDTCDHDGPSIIDHKTFQRSASLPLRFLRGCGLPDNLIDYLPSLLNHPIQLYSCFLSHSSRDGEFVRRLHADLQDSGVRCWFAPEDLKIGDRIRDTIDQVIRVREKLLVVLSENSIASQWVEDEVEAALEEERRSPKRRTLLIPVRIDDAILHTDRAWARTVLRTRHIGDFSCWKEHDAYQQSFARLLRDLRPSNPEQERLPCS